MLHEIAITPSVFYRESYAHPDVCDAHMHGIREALLEYLLVRDLRDSTWRAELQTRFGDMANPAKELIKKCIARGRLRVAPSVLLEAPTDSSGWCREALASHGRLPLAGILACPAVKATHAGDPIVASIDHHSTAPWWKQCVTSCHPDGPRVPRNTRAYLDRLGNILRHAKHIAFTDPHLDPTRYGYREFDELLKATARPNGPRALVEIHRVRYVGSGPSRTFPDRAEWDRLFRSSLGAKLAAVGVTVEVFIWNEEHDRHLISDLLGLHVGNGFDTTTDPNAVSTWTRLSSRDRDSVQRFYDPQARSSALYHRFKIGA